MGKLPKINENSIVFDFFWGKTGNQSIIFDIFSAALEIINGNRKKKDILGVPPWIFDFFGGPGNKLKKKGFAPHCIRGFP